MSGIARTLTARDARARLLLAFPFALFAAMTAATWFRWADPLIDLGRELSTPARLAAGERLYVDVRSYYGPLGAWLAAALFRLFGSHVETLLVASLLVGAIGLLALVRIADHLGGPRVAALAGGLVAGIPFFLPYGGSVPLPYSFGALLGATLSWWAIEVTLGGTGSPRRLAIAGLLTGLALAAKIDSGIPALVGILLAASLSPGSVRERIRALAVFGGAALATSAALYVFAGAGAPIATLRQEGFLAFLSVPVEWRVLYSHLTGSDQPVLRLLELAELLVVLVPFVAIAGGLVLLAVRRNAATGRPTRGPEAIAIASAAAALAAGAIALRIPSPRLAWLLELPPVIRVVPPVAVIAALAMTAVALHRPARLPGVALAVAAALASGRIFLHASYASPYATFGSPLALVLFTLLVTRTLPEIFSRAEPRARRALSLLGGALLLSWLAVHLDWKLHWYRTPGRFGEVRTPKGTFLVTPARRAAALQLLGDRLAAELRPGESFVVFTEGTFWNFVLGRPCPIPQEQVHPGMLDDRAEADLVARLGAAPPALVVLVDVDFAMWGSGRFGVDFGRRIGRFLAANYAPIGRIEGDPGRADHSLGVDPIVVLRRR